jgi:D-beta-D-heptose 7-phosphate kinase/D-beta-D-heptose 1-phosphate adenosyltransferase
MKTVLCSGGFDPLHIGHLRYLREAGDHGQVIVALNSDDWLMRKKGLVFMSWDARVKILDALACVNFVGPVDDSDGTICKALREWRPNFYANGGDRTEAIPAEDAVCEELGIEQLFGIGGEKIASSSDLLFDVLDKHPLNGP